MGVSRVAPFPCEHFTSGTGPRCTRGAGTALAPFMNDTTTERALAAGKGGRGLLYHVCMSTQHLLNLGLLVNPIFSSIQINLKTKSNFRKEILKCLIGSLFHNDLQKCHFIVKWFLLANITPLLAIDRAKSVLLFISVHLFKFSMKELS